MRIRKAELGVALGIGCGFAALAGLGLAVGALGTEEAVVVLGLGAALSALPLMMARPR